jgi:hypothetical protein
MKRWVGTRMLTAAAAAGAIALAAPASPALGYSFSLSLSGPSTGVVGEPMIIRATGQNPPPAEYWFLSWLEVDAIPAGVVTTCPAGYQEGHQIAVTTGGEYLAFSQRETVDSTGAFSNPVGFTPKAPGKWLICGYTDDGYTNTLATAAMTVDVKAAPAAEGPPAAGPPAAGPPAAVGGTRPANIKVPRVARSGRKLVCRPGRWTGEPDGFSYRWSVDGMRRKGAGGRQLLVTRRLRGRKVRCSVRASNAAGATTAVSKPVRVR